MDIKTRNTIVIKALPAINKEVTYFTNKYRLKSFMSSEEIEDMKSDCIVHIIKLIEEKFDVNKKVKVFTYIQPRIIGFLKDHIRLRQREARQKEVIQGVINTIDILFSMKRKAITMYMKNLNIDKDKCIQEMYIDMADMEYDDLLNCVCEMPKDSIYIVVAYYLMDKNIKTIAEELDVSATSGWVYKIKKEALKYLKKRLIEKGINEETLLC